MRFRLYLLILLILGTSNFVFAQNDWKTIPYQNWTKDQVKKVLNDSAWAKTTTYTEHSMETKQIGTINFGPMQARILLRSALPVRQALLRQRQLDAKYDKMNDADKKAFDTKNSALLVCPACTDYYVVSVLAKNLSMENKVYLADRKKYVYLSNESGEKRELVEFSVISQVDNEVVFYFPRRNEKGEPLLTEKSKKLTFNFELKGLDGKSVFPFEKFSFDVPSLIEDGKVAF